MIALALIQLSGLRNVPQATDESKTPFTIEEINEHNGVTKSTIYVGLYGFVFDVTDAPNY